MSTDRTHTPVMAQEVREQLRIDSGAGLIIDSTLGEGGHSALLLSDNPGARIIGVDADPEMLERARVLLDDAAGRVEFVNCWFDEFWRAYDGPAPDRVLFDLGVSFYHFSGAGRGFSLRKDEPLDMRLSGSGRTAAELIEELDEVEMADILFRLGGERYSRRIAKAIVRERADEGIRTSGRLAEVVRGAVPPAYRRGRNHPATRTFQALRIAVNLELDRLRIALGFALDKLSVHGGRLAVISFHSLEDRIVKWMFRRAAGMNVPEGSAGEDSIIPEISPTNETGGTAGEGSRFRIVTRKPLVPGESEARENAPSRSAKLRVVEKTLEEGGE
ncbi:MAG: 16S rRNA (cytosine(1402)-N(4))-methyltransferase RsmH [Spirochaetota bacterium]